MHENHKIQEPNFEGEEMKMPENTDLQPAVAEEKSSLINGPLLFVLALLLILILIGMYYWFTLVTAPPVETVPVVERPTAAENNEPESTTAEAQTDVMMTTSSSDELDAIYADIEATNFDDIDSDLNVVDTEIDSDLQTQ